MEFWKMNGAGNDFIVVDDRRNAIPENRWPEIVRVLCAYAALQNQLDRRN